MKHTAISLSLAFPPSHGPKMWHILHFRLYRLRILYYTPFLYSKAYINVSKQMKDSVIKTMGYKIITDRRKEVNTKKFYTILNTPKEGNMS